MTKYISIALICLLNIHVTIAQNNTEVKIPEFKDDFSKTVKMLENGETDIDYKAFRESFIESKQFKVASEKTSELRELKKEMYKLMSKSAFDSIITITKKMLSIDYTNMKAHKILRQTYEFTGDTINAKKYKAIQFGLLRSIVHNGDGKSCKTGWPVIQVSEEYFILEMIGVQVNKQNIDSNGGICDRMEVVDENGEKKVYYFEISNVFKGRENLKGM